MRNFMVVLTDKVRTRITSVILLSSCLVYVVVVVVVVVIIIIIIIIIIITTITIIIISLHTGCRPVAVVIIHLRM
jgi:hypothetical protein